MQYRVSIGALLVYRRLYRCSTGSRRARAPEPRSSRESPVPAGGAGVSISPNSPLARGHQLPPGPSATAPMAPTGEPSLSCDTVQDPPRAAAGPGVLPALGTHCSPGAAPSDALESHITHSLPSSGPFLQHSPGMQMLHIPGWRGETDPSPWDEDV